MSVNVLKIEIDKRKLNDYLESLVLCRIQNIRELRVKIYNEINLKLNLNEKLRDENERGFDFCLISNITVDGLDLAYINIYYLIDNSDNMIITETSVDYGV